jgi:hypothetical protein
MKYAILALILLMFAAGASAMEITEVKKPEMCIFDKRPINCAYLWGLFIGCKECPWKLKQL